VNTAWLALARVRRARQLAAGANVGAPLVGPLSEVRAAVDYALREELRAT